MSSQKRNILSFRSIVAGNMASASLTSTVTNIQLLDDIGIQFNWTGSPVGTFQVQVSADYAQDNMSPPNVTNSGNWVPLLFTYWNGSSFTTATSIPTSVGSPIYLDLTQLSSPWIRAVYTRSSGSGTLNVYLTAKEI